MVRVFVCSDGIVKVPKSYLEALKSIDRDKWMEAIKAEYNSLMENGTWEIVEPKKGAPIVGTKWVFTLKFNVDGSIKRYKARLVCQGFTQSQGIDYFETFAPVVNQVSLRMLLSMATRFDWDVNQVDFTTAFLNSPVKEEIYCRQPTGFVIKGKEGHVMRLVKSLYGLKQAPRNWYKMLSEFLQKELGLVMSEKDPCLFTFKSKNGIVLLSVYVDDLLITGSDKEKIKSIREEILGNFKCSDMGEVHQVVGLIVDRDRENGLMRIHQNLYIEQVCEKFESYLKGMKEFKTPASAETYRMYIDSVFAKERRTLVDFKYRELLGALLYISCSTRPDISNIVRFLTCFVVNWTDMHVHCALRVLKYLEGSRDLGLFYDRSNGNGRVLESHEESFDMRDLLMELEVISDASWADCYATACSTTGFTVFLYGNLISWKSVKQRIVARSSMESEYIALSNAVDELEVCVGILGAIGVECKASPLCVDERRKAEGNDVIEAINQAVRVFGDNTASIAVANGDGSSRRSRNINIRFHNVRQAVQEGFIEMGYVKTSKNKANILTKCVETNFLVERDYIVG